jgi:beta-lactamase class C
MDKKTLSLLLLLPLLAAPATRVEAGPVAAGGTMGYLDMIGRTAQGRKDIHITVGVLREGKADYRVYGKDGIELPRREYEYEIGSVTKTFTAALLARALGEGRVALDDSLGRYLPLEPGSHNPSILQLATHRAGYGEVLGAGMVVNTVLGRNPYLGYDARDLERTAAGKKMADADHAWNYSNFGMALLGDALGKAYGRNYRELMEAFLGDDLGLSHTRFGDGRGDLSRYWKWEPDDAYLAAGGLVSTIGDMLRYAELCMADSIPSLSAVRVRRADIGKPGQYGMRFDAIGLAWILDEENGIVWHNGGTGSFNSYVGFDPVRKIAVVVLADTGPRFRIPACVIGARLLRDLQQGGATGW